MRQFSTYATLTAWLVLAGVVAWVVPRDWHGWIGVFGTVATIAGLLYTFYQLALTKAAADAARDSAERTAQRLKRARVAQLLSRIRDRLMEFDSSLSSEVRTEAGRHSRLLADQITELSDALPKVDEYWLRVARMVRTDSNSLKEGAVPNVRRLRRLVADWIERASKEYQAVEAQNE